MAASPLDSSLRLRCHYEGPFGLHVMLFRGVTSATITSLVAGARAVITEMLDLQYDTTHWDSAEVANVGSNIFNFVSGWTPLISASGVTPGANNGIARFVNFGMRSLDGKRAKWYLYEVAQQEEPDYRVQSVSVAAFQNVIDELNDPANGIATILGEHGAAYQYANIGDNDYWVHKARRGA